MKAQRVIFELKDGRRKYATHNGSMLWWEENDLASLSRNVEHIGLLGFARVDGLLLDAGTNPVKKLVHATA